MEQLIPEIKDAAESSETPQRSQSIQRRNCGDRIFVVIAQVCADARSFRLIPMESFIQLDWSARRMFSVSVNKSRRLAYAGWFGEDSKVHGTEKLVTASLKRFFAVFSERCAQPSSVISAERPYNNLARVYLSRPQFRARSTRESSQELPSAATPFKNFHRFGSTCFPKTRFGKWATC